MKKVLSSLNILFICITLTSCALFSEETDDKASDNIDIVQTCEEGTTLINNECVSEEDEEIYIDQDEEDEEIICVPPTSNINEVNSGRTINVYYEPYLGSRTSNITEEEYHNLFGQNELINATYIKLSIKRTITEEYIEYRLCELGKYDDDTRDEVVDEYYSNLKENFVLEYSIDQHTYKISMFLNVVTILVKDYSYSEITELIDYFQEVELVTGIVVFETGITLPAE